LERTIEIQAEKQHQLERLMRSLLEPMTSGQIHVGGAVAAPAPELETAA
jgi:hypothetical protein